MKNLSEIGTTLSRDEAKSVVAGAATKLMINPRGAGLTTCSTSCTNGSTVTIDCDGHCTSVNEQYVVCNKTGGGQEVKRC